MVHDPLGAEGGAAGSGGAGGGGDPMPQPMYGAPIPLYGAAPPEK